MKKVNENENCPFLKHVGKYPNSPHKNALGCYHSITNQSQHIENIVEKQTTEQVAKNRLRVKTMITAVRWLTFQGCAFRGRDESKSSKNRGNFVEMIKLLASYNEEVAATVLENAPQNASYHSHGVQKEILSIFSRRIQKFICEEINDSRFCILVDESRDESKREQMVIVLRFVDKDGFVRERFFDIIHVVDTASTTLKEAICMVLSRHNLSVHNIRGQGYDGASNMRGDLAGLQALFAHECPYAYYVHCFAHRLQLALVAASKEVMAVWQFFSNLNLIINIVGASCKRHDQLKAAKAAEIAELLAIGDEFVTGKGKNQVGTLKRAADTRWGSHFGSICSLIEMFKATLSVLSDIISNGSTASQRAEADGAFDAMTTFEFVFELFLMRELMEITDDLSQALQNKSQDILNAMHLVSTTKTLIQKFRDNGWDPLLEKVNTFSRDHDIVIPDMNGPYSGGRGRHRSEKGITNYQYFRVEVFIAAIDSQSLELNHRFKDDVMELLILSSALDPRDSFKAFKIDDICKLANNYYPMDFSNQEKIHLKFQLENYELDILVHPEFRNLSTISELCQVMSKTRKSIIYPLIDRLIRLVLTLPVSTATTERAFSAMKLVKTRLRNKMEDDYLASYLITYIEKDIARGFDFDSMVDEFDGMKDRRAQLRNAHVAM